MNDFAVSLILMSSLTACTTGETRLLSTQADAPERTYVERRRAHATVLTRRAPITHSWPDFPTPSGAERVTFASSYLDARGTLVPLDLWGWFALPSADTQRQVPALLYLHGHHFMKPRDFERLKPLKDRGFAIMTATLRGRNGNQGAHELLYGEVDDAVAAARWLAAHPAVDPQRIYVFGHSLGGGVAALMSLLPAIPVRMTGGCGAVYSTETFKNWSSSRDQDLVRFDWKQPNESELRVLLPHVAQMLRPHWAYMGTREKITQRNARRAQSRAARAGTTFEVEIVEGGHADAIEPALTHWFDVIVADAGFKVSH